MEVKVDSANMPKKTDTYTDYLAVLQSLKVGNQLRKSTPMRDDLNSSKPPSIVIEEATYSDISDIR